MRRRHSDDCNEGEGGAIDDPAGRADAERRLAEGDAERSAVLRGVRREVRCPRCGLGQAHHDSAGYYTGRPGIFVTLCSRLLGGCDLKFEYGLERVFEREQGPWGDTYAELIGSGGKDGGEEKETDDATVGQEASGEQAAGPYLEYPGNIVDGEESEVVGVRHEVRACGCRSRFCRICAIPLGLRLRERLTDRIRFWNHLQMWTLTVDPDLFDTPAQAFLHVRNRRAIGEFVRALWKAGLLENRHYFCAVEWQQRTAMAHYHLLVQAKHIPFALAAEVWNRNRPEGAGPVLGPRPGFGSIRFSKCRFEGGGEHAANYATKYLVKHPEHGFPDWVLNFPGQIRRYSTSMGFWGAPPKKPADKPKIALEEIATKKSPPEPKPHQPTCFCLTCRGDSPEDDGNFPRRLSTIRERLTRCGERAVAMAVLTIRDSDGALRERHDYRFALPVSMQEFLTQYDGKPDDRRSVALNENEYHQLLIRSRGGRRAA